MSGTLEKVAIITLGGASIIEGYLIYQILKAQDQASLQNNILPTPTLSVPGVLPTGLTPESASATPNPSSIPEAQKPVDRMSAWLSFWPDTAEEAASMFGGIAGDWQKSPDWPGDKTAKSTFYDKDYNPIEWKPVNPDNTPYYWPKTSEEAAAYFFPGLKPEQVSLLSPWMRKNQYGGWELMQDHWMDGLPADLTATIYPGVVAEGYTVHGDDVAENDRNFVAWGGKNNGVNAGIALPLASGQGMTLWPPGADPNKIGVEGKPYNIPYYTGPNDEQLGPNAINFTPIYNAPEFEIIGATQHRGILAQINDFGSTLGNVPSKPIFGSTLPGFIKDPWKGMTQARGNRGGNGSYGA